MSYRPQELNVGDTWYFHREGLTHCIHMQQRCPGSTADLREEGALGHAVSRDLIHWETCKTALYRGEDGSYDDLDLWTGSVIEHEGLLYLFYTARCSAHPGDNYIALATSRDGENWVKHPGNPIITPDPRWYHGVANPTRLACHGRPIVDCRDLCVVRDQEKGGFWGFYAARQPGDECAVTSVIALCHSDDLVHWEQFPPCFAPGKYACIEVPDVFYLSGKWYMLCLTGNAYGQRCRLNDPGISTIATIYAVADRPQGPYKELDENILIGSVGEQGYCSKTVEADGKRYVFYTQKEQRESGSYRSVSFPKELKTDGAGHLRPCWYDGVESYIGAELLDGAHAKAIENHGQWGSIGRWQKEGGVTCGGCSSDWALHVFDCGGDCYVYEATVDPSQARSAGLAFGIKGDDAFGGAYIVLLDEEAGEIMLTRTRQFPVVEVRKWPVIRGKSYRLKVLVVDGVTEVYVDNVLALQAFLPGLKTGRLGLFVEQGTARFEGIAARGIRRA